MVTDQMEGVRATRVVRTEFFFNHEQIEKREGVPTPDFPGVSFAWFKDQEPSAVMKMRSVEFDGIEPNLMRVCAFLDAALYEAESPTIPLLYNQKIIDYLLEQQVVIEQSPPESLPLLNLISHGTNFSVGSYLGFAVAAGNIPLMFITVPAGIIVMGAAMGISNGLKNGLQKTVERMFAASRPRTTPPSPRGTRKAKSA